MRLYELLRASQLPPELTSLDLPALALRLTEEVADLDPQAAREGEALHRAGAELLAQERDRAEDARRLSCAALVLARRVGEALGEPGRGRPSAEAELPLPEIEARKLRDDYRRCAEPTAAEFAEWVQTSPVLTRPALARYGRRLRALRDAETGEPLTSPPVDSPSAPAPDAPGAPDAPALFAEEAAVERPGEGEDAPLRSHHALSALALLGPVEDALHKLPHQAQREALRLVEHLRALLAPLVPE